MASDGATQAGIPSVTAPDIGTAPLTVDARFALQPLTGPLAGPLPVQTSAAGGRPLRREDREGALAEASAARASDREPDQDDDRADGGEPEPTRGARVKISQKAAHTPGLGDRAAAARQEGAARAAAPGADHDLGQRRGRRARRARRRNGDAVRQGDELPGEVDGADLHALLDAERPARSGQLLLPARSGGARARRPGESADRADRADPQRPAALPHQGQAPLPLQQPLLPAARVCRDCPRPR